MILVTGGPASSALTLSVPWSKQVRSACCSSAGLRMCLRTWPTSPSTSCRPMSPTSTLCSRSVISTRSRGSCTLAWPVTNDDPIDASGRALEAFLNIVRAARAWGVRRVVTASTIGVYGFASAGALNEDTPLSMEHFHVIPTFKKITELLSGHLSDVTDVKIVNARISGTWGPGGHLPDPFFAAPSLVHAAARCTAGPVRTHRPRARRGCTRPALRQGHGTRAGPPAARR